MRKLLLILGFALINNIQAAEILLNVKYVVKFKAQSIRKDDAVDNPVPDQGNIVAFLLFQKPFNTVQDPF